MEMPITDPRPRSQLRRARGLWTIMEVAAATGVPKSTLWDWIDTGNLPRPTLSLNGYKRKYFTTKEVEQICEMVDHLHQE